MTLIDRVRSLFGEPSVLSVVGPQGTQLQSISGHLKTMTCALAQQRSEIENVRLELERVGARLRAAAQERDSYNEAAEAAVADGSDSLARAALSQFLNSRREASQYSERQLLLTSRLKELEASLSERQERLERLRARLADFARAEPETAREAAEDPGNGPSWVTEHVPEEEVELELLRRKNAAQSTADDWELDVDTGPGLGSVQEPEAGASRDE